MLATAASKGRSLDSILKGSRRVTFNLTRNVAGLNTCVSDFTACSRPSVSAWAANVYSSEPQDIFPVKLRPIVLLS